MKVFRSFTLALAMVLAAACASLGAPTAQTFNEKAAYAVGINQSIYDTVTSTENAGTLSSADGESVIKQNDTAKAVIDTAIAAHNAGDEAGANAKLVTAISALQALQDYLRAHGAKP